jgi:hypothetical protein
LWFLLFGGVLERHPHLNLAFTEQNADWIPLTVNCMDDRWAGKAFAEQLDARPLCPRAPREY